MLFGLLPMLVLPLLAYWPPSDVGGAINAVWLTGVLSCYYVFATMYSGPHGALIPEIARSDEDRARLTRLLALCAFPMAGLLMTWPRGIDWGREVGMAPTESMRAIVIVLAGAVTAYLCTFVWLSRDQKQALRNERHKRDNEPSGSSGQLGGSE